ncbi:MAG: hypothetical protein WC641_02245 [Patescibacteria group bacterium]
MSAQDEALSLLSFVRNNPRGLREIRDLEVAKWLMQSLLSEGVDPLRLLTRALNSHHPQALVRILHERVTGEERRQILDRLAACFRKRGSGTLYARDIAKRLKRFIGEPAEITYLLKNHRDILNNPEFELSQSVVDRYWFQRIESHFVCNDGLVGAWIALKKANLGFSDYAAAAPEECAQSGPETRAHAASNQALGQMLREIYLRLSSQGALDPDLLRRFRVVVKRDASKVPGIQIAKRFVDGTGPDKKKLLWFTEEGGIALQLTAYFNTRKKSKHKARRGTGPSGPTGKAVLPEPD